MPTSIDRTSRDAQRLRELGSVPEPQGPANRLDRDGITLARAMLGSWFHTPQFVSGTAVFRGRNLDEVALLAQGTGFQLSSYRQCGAERYGPVEPQVRGSCGSSPRGQREWLSVAFPAALGGSAVVNLITQFESSPVLGAARPPSALLGECAVRWHSAERVTLLMASHERSVRAGAQLGLRVGLAGSRSSGSVEYEEVSGASPAAPGAKFPSYRFSSSHAKRPASRPLVSSPRSSSTSPLQLHVGACSPSRMDMGAGRRAPVNRRSPRRLTGSAPTPAPPLTCGELPRQECATDLDLVRCKYLAEASEHMTSTRAQRGDGPNLALYITPGLSGQHGGS